MIKMPYDDILAKIEAGSDLDRNSIETKIKAKCDQLSGLISKEGAAHIVANELGVKLFEKVTGKVTLKDMLPGMRDLEVVGKVSAVYEVREFQGRNGPGKVGNFMLADETGVSRVVCWGHQAELVSKLQQGNVILIKGCYVKENQGRTELHCNDRTQIEVNPDGVEVNVDVSSVQAPQRAAATRVPIKELKEGQENVEVMGAIVQIHDPRFWEACPQCNRRAKHNSGVYMCDTHGEVKIDFSYVMNCFIDDGSDNIRVVFFKNQAQRLTEKSHQEFLAYRENPGAFEDVKHDLLGKMVKLTGKVQKNSMFDRLEFVSQLVDPKPNPEAELAKVE
ncbi:MAG: OB-fold nucleic acid binding domain-containing protein [Candidatus Nanoarchaeia archaeon]